MYLLDSNAVSDIVRNPQGRVAARIADVGDDNVATSVIVAAEMRYGAVKKGSSRLSRQLEAVLSALPVLPFEAPADQAYARIRAALERAGTPIGANDMLIAAHAVAIGMVVVTNNVRQFKRVRGLRVENWLR